MPTVDENRVWNTTAEWGTRGDHWSGAYGGPDSQWYGSLLPRIHTFVPTGTILEIACGHGRWTNYLKDLGDHLIVVDLNEQCIDACRARFSDVDNISYFVNDGMSLGFIESGSVDFAFSFDSLVHADRRVMASYLQELARVLAPEGVAFLHHSNLAEYKRYLRASTIPHLVPALRRVGLLEKSDHWRDRTVSAAVVAMLAEQNKLCCVSHEAINWGDTKQPIDCITVLARSSSSHARPTRRLTNGDFVSQARYLKRLDELYG